MTEQIGKITLDLSKYPGEDLYCDGAVEDELLDIVQKYSQVEYPQLIEQRKSWPILYHLSPAGKHRGFCGSFIPGQGAGGRQRLRGHHRSAGQKVRQRHLCGFV